MTKSAQPSSTQGLLNWIERSGNRLPDPVFIFIWCIAVVVSISVIASFFGISALHPTILNDAGNPLMIRAESLLSSDNIRRLLVDMPATFTGFHPLGYVLVVMLGAGVAERSGLFATAMSSAMSKAPSYLLTPAVALIGMLGNLAADAAYVVLIPLAGVVFAAAGRHPIAGIAAAFAGVSGGFSANLIPGQLEPLLFGITEAAAETLDPTWNANMLGNWYFISGMTLIFLPVIWYVTDKIIEPRLDRLMPSNGASETAGIVKSPNSKLQENEVNGLKNSGIALISIIALWILLCIVPGTPLIDDNEVGIAKYNPLLQSFVAGFFIVFLAMGWAYGHGAGTIKNHRDVVQMMSESMSDLAYYLVLAFTAAHFVAMFAWSNLGLIFAINGASFLHSSNLRDAVLLSLIIVFGAIIH